MKAPKKIWLQHEDREHPDCDNYFGDGMTWCEDKINDDDVEYIRKDEALEYARQKCKEQRELCRKEFNHLGTYHGTVVWDKIQNRSPEPEFE